MSKFGWSYPAGAANDPFAPYNQTDVPCSMCGQWPDDCICPECPVCHTHGSPKCYIQSDSDYGHGLLPTQAQIQSLAAKEAEWKADNDSRVAIEQEDDAKWQKELDALEKAVDQQIEVGTHKLFKYE